jgi:hypothetical protein
MPRGRLVFPFLVELGLLDTDGTAADPDGAGELTSGYDDDFREPVMVASGSTSARGALARAETVLTFMAQVEDDTDDAVSMAASGNNPTNTLGLVFHFRDLELAGAVQLASGDPIIKAPGARLISISNPRTGVLIKRYDARPGYWATQAKSMGYGLGPQRNLLLVIFQERDVSAPSTGG